MGVLRWLGKISLTEWLIIGIALSWLIRRPAPRTRSAAAGPAAPRAWAIDACVAVTVLGILAGAIWQQSWMSLIGFAAAALGLGLTVRGMMRALGRWMGRLFSKPGRRP